MSKEERQTSKKKFSLLGTSVLVSVILASSFFPLRPLVQQALIGITIIWLYVSIMTGFNI